jgi:site-specific DNA-methyltransferase (adenine-specific)
MEGEGMSDKQEVRIGNCLDLLKEMPDESIDVVVTSPPYWALRDYGSEPVVWGGDPGCTHSWEDHTEPARGGVGETANVGANKDGEANNRGHPTTTQYCTKCGAWRGQLGLEPSPYEYIDHLITIFDEVKRVLKPTGACWVNIGDTYSTFSNAGLHGNLDNPKSADGLEVGNNLKKNIARYGFPSKTLIQIPSRFAIAMTDRGWILRNEIIWQKANCMPTSVKDRFTVDFEKFYFFTKSPKYYFKQVKEPLAPVSIERAKYGFKTNKANIGPNTREGGGWFGLPDDGHPFRSCGWAQQENDMDYPHFGIA